MSGWGSWGNWISTTVSSVVDTSAKIVSELTTTADEEVANEKKSGSLKLYRTEEEIEAERKEKEQIVPPEESELERIFLSSASAVVDGTFKTFDTVFTGGAKIIKSVETKNVSEIVENTSAKAKGVFQSAIQFLSLDELEEDQQVAGNEDQFSKQNNNNNNNNNRGEENGQRGEVEEVIEKTPSIELAPSFQRYYEEYLGNIHLQALELLSMECMMKTHEFQRKGNKAIVSIYASHLQEIKDKFEDEDDVDYEELQSTFSTFTFNSKIDAIRSAIELQHTTSTNTANTIINELKNKIAEYKQNNTNKKTTVDHHNGGNNNDGNDDGNDHTNDGDAENKEVNQNEVENTLSPSNKLSPSEFISTLSSEYLLKLHNECLLILAKHSSFCVELVNRIAENMLIEAKKLISDTPAVIESEPPSLTSIPPTNTLIKLSYFKYLSNSLADDISKLSYPFVSASKSVASILKEQFSEEDISSVEELVKSSINNIYLDTGDANSTIFNSMSNIVAVLQWIYVFSEAKLTQPE